MIIVVIVIAVGSYFLYDKYSQSSVRDFQNAASPTQNSADIKSLRGGETRRTPKPSRFRGKVAKAYSIAQEELELLDGLYCYCKTKFGHRSLLICFVDRHAVECNTCLNQAIYAFSLFEKGQYYPRVREAVDRKFWRPFS